MLNGTGYSSTSECFSSLQATISNKKQSKNKKIFNDEQIRSLEIMFESETKLEPRKKIELAKELGLQPRQVAIWFQNKRARWKSKQIEKNYNVLLADYSNLASQFESLQKENESLLSQLQKLKNEMVGNQEMEIQEKAWDNNINGESDYGKMDFKVRNDERNYGDSSVKAGEELLRLDEENDELLKMADSASLTSVNRDWRSVDCDDLINQPTQWWDFWSE